LRNCFDQARDEHVFVVSGLREFRGLHLQGLQGHCTEGLRGAGTSADGARDSGGAKRRQLQLRRQQACNC